MAEELPVKIKAGSYRDLLVWRKGLDLAKRLYKMTGAFPNEEKYGLVSQIRRAAVSVPSNIAEGQARHSANEFIQFLYVAKGSLSELDTQCVLAHELGFIDDQQTQGALAAIDELQKMIYSLIRRLQNSKPKT